jgi:hypothetical protein
MSPEIVTQPTDDDFDLDVRFDRQTSEVDSIELLLTRATISPCVCHTPPCRGVDHN